MSEVLFGMVNLETRTSHEGYIDEKGKMAFRAEGTPISDEYYEKAISASVVGDLPAKIQEEIFHYKGWLTTARWGQFATFLRKSCMKYGVAVEITSESGWIRVTTFYTLTGTRKNIEALNKYVEEALDDWQNR